MKVRFCEHWKRPWPKAFKGELIKGAYGAFFAGAKKLGALHHGKISRTRKCGSSSSQGNFAGAKVWEFIITIPGGSVINRNWQEYDQAEWLLSMAVGKYAALISAERSMPAADQAKIDEWLEKQAAAADLLDDLDLLEPAKVSEVLAKFKEEC